MRPPTGIRVGELYLRWALERPTDAETMLRDRIFERMPQKVLDCHAHMNGPGAARDLTPYGWAQRRSSFPEWDVPSHELARSLLYPGITLHTIWMPQPHLGIDHRRANRYVLDHKGPGDYATLCGLPDDPDYTLDQIATGSYVALKMYPHFVEPPYRHVDDYFPAWALRAVNSLSMPIILHLPVPLSDCFHEVLQISNDHPGIKIVLAHLGREPEAGDGTSRVFHELAQYNTISMDMSMVTSRPLHALALATLGPDRILYGSDEPFNLLRYVELVDPERGRTVVSNHDYHWNKQWARDRYSERARNAPLLHFQALSALFGAADEVYGENADRELVGVFWSNAHRVFPIGASQ